jgi:hypothetical protein
MEATDPKDCNPAHSIFEDLRAGAVTSPGAELLPRRASQPERPPGQVIAESRHTSVDCDP